MNIAEKDFFKQIGANVARYRKKRGLTQKEFAEKIGLSYPFVAGLECGQHSTTIKTLKKIADSLSVEPCQLLAGEDDIILSKSAMIQNCLNKAEE